MPQSRDNNADLARIAVLEREAASLEREACRNVAEASLRNDRVQSIRRLVELIKTGRIEWGHP